MNKLWVVFVLLSLSVLFLVGCSSDAPVPSVTPDASGLQRISVVSPMVKGVDFSSSHAVVERNGFIRFDIWTGGGVGTYSSKYGYLVVGYSNTYNDFFSSNIYMDSIKYTPTPEFFDFYKHNIGFDRGEYDFIIYKVLNYGSQVLDVVLVSGEPIPTNYNGTVYVDIFLNENDVLPIMSPTYSIIIDMSKKENNVKIE